MFCPKCGTENPETGRFCRSCGTDLGNITDALSGKLTQPQQIVDRKGRPVSYESALVKIFTGIAFLIVSVALAFTAMGKTWWFWMLIPGFTSLGAGIAQYVQLKNASQASVRFAPPDHRDLSAPAGAQSLPPSQTEYVPPAESRYKTGDLVPPSVTEGTTRHLETDPEGETMTLPKI
jgi:hypothetical protein